MWNSEAARDNGFFLNMDTCQVSLRIMHTFDETGRWHFNKTIFLTRHNHYKTSSTLFYWFLELL